MKTPDSRGQIFTTDLIIAVTVFLFILTLTIIYSNQVAIRVDLWDEKNERELAALLASRALVLSPGEPSNWENLGIDEIESIGLTDTKNVISPSKLQRFVDLNENYYGDAKGLLGLSKYGARIEIRDLNKQLVESFGLEPDSNKHVSTFARVALYEGEAVLVRVKVFE